MKIIEALKDENIPDIEITHASKWLVYCNKIGFTVYEHRQRKILQTFDEDKAVEALLKE